VDFGLFYEICVPRPWDPGKEAQIVRQVIEQVRFAEEMGFKYVWLTEHHFLEEFSHCSAPEVLLAALSQVTTTMRLGHGVVLTPPAYNHPVRVAERIAMLDCISGGRVEIGTGRSSTPTELEGFGIDGGHAREMWLEGLQGIVKLLVGENVVLEGEYVSMPARTVVPRCVQQPHPPLWMAGTSPSTTERAAAAGLGVLFFAHGILPESLAESVEVYRATIKQAEPIGLEVNEGLAGFCNALCLEDDKEARELGGRASFEYVMKGMSLARWPRGVTPPPTYEYTVDSMWRGRERLEAMGPEGMIESGMVIAGGPDRCYELCERYAEVGVDQLILHMQTWDTPHEKIMGSIAAFGEHIIPGLGGSLAADTRRGD
jgi:alkanesulfonate monooxygenase SsuD/methylene tetrahydromethanopterin reductase-like flavin-dependent oxidoreductase (luciferase family)